MTQWITLLAGKRWPARRMLGLLVALLIALAPAPPAPTVMAQAVWPAGEPVPNGDLSAPFPDIVPLDIPSAEWYLVQRINELRIGNRRNPLVWDDVLADLARQRSWDMIDRNYFSHEIPGVGSAPWWLLAQVTGARGTGENLGMSNLPNGQVVDSLFDDWVASPTHLENMVRPEFTRIGMGIIEVPTTWAPGSTVKVVTQLYAIAPGPLGRAAPTG